MERFTPKNTQFEHELGTIENPIIDSQMILKEALLPNPNFFLAPEVFERQIILPVKYISFNGKYHQGQIVVDKEVEKEVQDFFNFLMEKNFPIGKTIPIADKKYNNDDALSMNDNNSSGFNPRGIRDTGRPSNHALGRAIDINPLQNPCTIEGKTDPVGAIYDPKKPGTLTAEIVEFLKEKGWRWGGEYHDLKDYMHLEKLLAKNNI